MTTIAWDGLVLAADKRATNAAGVISLTTKIRRLADDTLLGWSGPIENGLQLADWYTAGADPSAWPACQSDSNFAVLIVVKPNGTVYEYESLPVPQQVEDSKMAWGSGKMAALAAMHCGMSATAAVEVAAKFDVYTGSETTLLRLIV